MDSKRILKMLNDGKVEELKKIIQDEIYIKELSSTPGAKHRYAAMKRYFKYADKNDKRLSMPCIVGDIACFTDSFTAIRTSEDIGDIQPFEGDYFNLKTIFDMEKLCTYIEKIDFNEVLAEAKSKGYKYGKSEIGRSQDFTTVFFYNGAYFKVGLLDQAFSIINDGEKATVYSTGKEKNPIKIITSIGECILLPANPKIGGFDNKTVIKIASKY